MVFSTKISATDLEYVVHGHSKTASFSLFCMLLRNRRYSFFACFILHTTICCYIVLHDTVSHGSKARLPIITTNINVTDNEENGNNDNTTQK